MTAPPFDLLGSLPTGRLAVEASAGTGKTYTLAGLATRYLAERPDVTTADLLLVTFTRAATSELRARVRDRLAAAVRALRGDEEGDELSGLLAATDRQARQARLERALAEFDAATITTIHGFAAQMLAAAGAVGPVDPDLRLLDDRLDLALAVASDVVAGAAVAPGSVEAVDATVLPSEVDVAGLAAELVDQPDLGLFPDVDDDAVLAEHKIAKEVHRGRLAREAARRMVDLRRRAGGRAFGDLLTDLRDVLLHHDTAAAVRAVLAGRFPIALIDEFQDTDPVQWSIFEALFGAEVASAEQPATLVLVGDPKQAIYAFRGANVQTYLDAVRSGPVRTLGTNWRSDGAMLGALATLFDGVTFGEESIAFRPVGVAPQHRDRRVVDALGAPVAPLVLRVADAPDLPHTTRGVASPGAVHAVVEDLVVQVVHHLDQVRLPTDDGSGHRPVRPSDIAVLVRTRQESQQVQDALIEAGVPAVLARGTSVLQSPAALQWRWLLEALVRPSDPRAARMFALSWFGGKDATWVATARDEELAELQGQLQRWAELLVRAGFVAFRRTVWQESGLAERVLARRDGDRSMTDLDHLAELLTTQATSSRPSAAGLLAVLANDVETDANVEFEGNAASRRVESEADAVQIMTVWVAKGLEFPITCVPTLWRKGQESYLFHDEESGQRFVDLLKAAAWPDTKTSKARVERRRQEQLGENLRLLYVALTRAKHRCLVWFAPTPDAKHTGLAHVLYGRDEAGRYTSTGAVVALPDEAELHHALQPLVANAEGRIALGRFGRARGQRPRWADPLRTDVDEALGVEVLDRPLPRQTRRWSFTAITAERDHDHDPLAAAGSVVAELVSPGPVPTTTLDGTTSGAALVLDEPPAADPHERDRGGPAPGAPAPDGPSPVGAVPPWVSPMASLPAGATFGTLVHGVFEHVDFASAALADDIAAEVDRERTWRHVDLSPTDVTRPDAASDQEGRRLLIEAIAASMDTPLGPAMGDRRLVDLTRADRLDELDFDLRLADGGTPATDRAIGALVEAHLGPDLDGAHPLRRWAADLAQGTFGVTLAGHLTGSIDLVARVRDPQGADRFVIVDYKTNRLHARGQVPERDAYHPDRVAAAMVEHHYHLQGLLYAVALHRYLRWRLVGYDPQVHLGGMAYLFLRGLAGPGTPVAADGTPHGVGHWAIPAPLVVATSDLLAGRALVGAAPAAPAEVTP